MQKKISFLILNPKKFRVRIKIIGVRCPRAFVRRVTNKRHKDLENLSGEEKYKSRRYFLLKHFCYFSIKMCCRTLFHRRKEILLVILMFALIHILFDDDEVPESLQQKSENHNEVSVLQIVISPWFKYWWNFNI